MQQSRWSAVVLVLATALALACLGTLFSPRQYVASGGVLLPGGMLKVQFTAANPREAADLVRAFIAQQKEPLLVDPPLVAPVAPDLLKGVLLAVIAALFASVLLLWRRAPPVARSENELNAALGVPLLAARPLAAQHLAQQLVAHWFGPGHALLAVVSPEKGDGRTRVAAELARALAAMGEPTLLIDADLRSPALHRAFGLSNRAGLADFLGGGTPRIVQCAENLSVLVAGRAGADPLELLSRGRMQELLAAAARRYRVVLIDTPAAARGPDLQLFAAFAGGALVVAKRPAALSALKNLHGMLKGCSARVVGTVLSPAASQ